MVEETRPYRIARDGAIVDRETGMEVGHVHQNDYGWHAELATGQRETMHATRRQACDSVWSRRLRTSPEERTAADERQKALERRLAAVEQYAARCAVMRVEPSTKGLRDALDGA